MPDLHEGSAGDVPWPLWLFDSPLLRQALAQVNLPAVPAIVRAACGLSQRDLAAIVGWSPAALSYYERGQRDGMFDIRTALQFADAVGMPRAALLPLVFADPDARPGGRHRGRDGHGTGPAWFRRPWPRAGVAAVLPSVSAPQGVSSSHVRYWRACTDTLYARDRAGRRDRLALAGAPAVAARPAGAEGRRCRGNRPPAACGGWGPGAVHGVDRAGWRVPAAGTALV